VNATTTSPNPHVRSSALAVLDRASAEVAGGRPFGSMEVLDLALDLRSLLQDDLGFTDVLATIDTQLGYNAMRIVGNDEVAAFIAAVRAGLDTPSPN
jgi:hypothetical protein